MELLKRFYALCSIRETLYAKKDTIAKDLKKISKRSQKDLKKKKKYLDYACLPFQE